MIIALRLHYNQSHKTSPFTMTSITSEMQALSLNYKLDSRCIGSQIASTTCEIDCSAFDAFKASQASCDPVGYKSSQTLHRLRMTHRYRSSISRSQCSSDLSSLDGNSITMDATNLTLSNQHGANYNDHCAYGYFVDTIRN